MKFVIRNDWLAGIIMSYSDDNILPIVLSVSLFFAYG